MPFRRSLVPMSAPRTRSDWWDTWDYPSRFGRTFFDEDIFDRDVFRRRRLPSSSVAVVEPKSAGVSEVVNDADKFEIRLDVSHFKPSEITVKTVGNEAVVVHARHEEREDEHGFVSREFTRRYVLPEDVDGEAVSSEIQPPESCDGVTFLTVKAPKKSLQEAPVKERVVPIAVRKAEQ